MANEITTTITFADGDQVTSAKLNQIISGASFGSGAVTGTTLTVTGGKLKVGTITSAEMGTSSVSSTAIQTDSVTTTKILDGAVTAQKLGTFSVTTSKIADSNITFEKFSTSIQATKSEMEGLSSSALVTPFGVKYSPGSAKAYGEFSIATSSRSIKANSLNIASLTRIDSTHTTVTLDSNMNSENYTVMCSYVDNGSSPENLSVSVYEKAAGSFKVVHPSEATGRAVNFVVFGKYA